MNALRDAALQFAARKGWRVIRLHTTRNGRCTCGKPCGNSAGKHPWGLEHGLKEATRDPTTIERWWREKPRANVGVATGGGLVVVDIDTPENAAVLAQLAAEHGAFPETLRVTTGRGVHLYFAGDVGSSHTIGPTKLLIRGEGGLVVVPPSLHYSGRQYQWDDESTPPAPLPDWFRDWVLRNSESAPQAADVAPINLGPRPTWLVAPDLSEQAEPPEQEEREYTFDEVVNALRRIPASVKMEKWLNEARSLHDWDSGDLGLRIFLAWSASSTDPKHQTPEARSNAETEWHRIKKEKPGKKMRRISSLFHDAAQYPVPPPVIFQQNVTSDGQINGFHHESQTFVQQVRWVDTDEDGNPRSTCTNARVAIRGLGVCCEKDTFHEKLIVGGHAIQQWAGELSDDAVLMMRQLIKEAFRFDPGETHTRDAAVQLCLANQFNPVVDYLSGLQWDGRSRIGRWVVDYLGAEDTALGCEFGRLMLIAAVRRARRPGTKFDQIIVLEGPEGVGKSSALRILAGPENFSDQRILGVSDREQAEATCGVWIHEIAELAGMRRAEVEAVKAFASRQEDRARPAYGRFRVDRPRQTVFVATTNANTYLKSDTGDRRFWPMVTGRINLQALERDRDQLWAEAATCESQGAAITLNPKFWLDAARVQASRQEVDPWFDEIAEQIGKKALIDVSVREVLFNFLRIDARQCGQVEQNRAARVLRMLGFSRYRKRDGELLIWRYRRVEVGTQGTVGT